MPHIFISYSKRNKSYARRLADHLIASGFDVWIDDRIDYGSLWADVIQQAIEDCAAFIVIMTPESEGSPWVKTECEFATQKGKKVFPLLLAGDVFFRYVSVQVVNVKDESLPPDAFLDELAEVAPHKSGSGENVTAPEARAEPPAARTPRRMLPFLVGTGILAALLVVLILVLQNRSDGDPQTHASDDETETPTRAVAVTRVTHEGDCTYDWFFGTEHAEPGDCPLSEAVRYHGFMQRFEDAVLIGIDIGRYYILYNEGTYIDIVDSWYTTTDTIGGCPFPTIDAFSEIMSTDGYAEDVLGCPLGLLAEEELSYQISDTSANVVIYIGAPEGSVYRLDAPSSRPGTEGTWEPIR